MHIASALRMNHKQQKLFQTILLPVSIIYSFISRRTCSYWLTFVAHNILELVSVLEWWQLPGYSFSIDILRTKVIVLNSPLPGDWSVKKKRKDCSSQCTQRLLQCKEEDLLLMCSLLHSKQSLQPSQGSWFLCPIRINNLNVARKCSVFHLKCLLSSSQQSSHWLVSWILITPEYWSRTDTSQLFVALGPTVACSVKEWGSLLCRYDYAFCYFKGYSAWCTRPWALIAPFCSVGLGFEEEEAKTICWHDSMQQSMSFTTWQTGEKALTFTFSSNVVNQYSCQADI